MRSLVSSDRAFVALIRSRTVINPYMRIFDYSLPPTGVPRQHYDGKTSGDNLLRLPQLHQTAQYLFPVGGTARHILQTLSAFGYSTVAHQQHRLIRWYHRVLTRQYRPGRSLSPKYLILDY